MSTANTSREGGSSDLLDVLVQVSAPEQERVARVNELHHHIAALHNTPPGARERAVNREKHSTPHPMLHSRLHDKMESENQKARKAITDTETRQKDERNA